MKKRDLKKRVQELERELEREREDWQQTHDALWLVMRTLCDEFGVMLSVRPRDVDVSEDD